MNSNVATRWANREPELKSLLRMVAALTFMTAGAMKLFAFPMGMPPDGGTAVFGSQVWLGGVLEVFGGGLLLLGLFTRPVAFLLSGEMAVAYFQFHQPGGFWPIVNGGVSAVIYCLVWLYFSAAGAGPWSLDALRSRRAGADRVARPGLRADDGLPRPLAR
jgi:putative oxidoreductase